jgi:hypothetical protein
MQVYIYIYIEIGLPNKTKNATEAKLFHQLNNPISTAVNLEPVVGS